MKSHHLSASFLVLLLSASRLCGETPEPDAQTEAPELTATREKFEAQLAPYRASVEQKIKPRAERYVKDLEGLVPRLTASGKLDQLPALTAEMDTYAKGGASAGFDPKDKKIAEDLRRLRSQFQQDTGMYWREIAAKAVEIARGYDQALTTQLTRMAAEKRLDIAMQLQAEKEYLKRIGYNPLADPFELLTKALGGTKWSWGSESRILNLSGDGKGGQPGIGLKWMAIGPHEISLSVISAGDGSFRDTKATMTFDDRITTFIGKDFFGDKVVKGKLLK